MSVQHYSSEDEVTFGDLAKGFRHLYHSFLIKMYQFFQFIWKSWLLLLILIIIGAGVGFWLDSRQTPQKKTTLITQINYSSAAVIYDAVDQLNRKIKDNADEFLTHYNLTDKNNRAVLKRVEIAPVVNLNDILSHYHMTPEQDRLAHELIKEAEKEEGDLLTSEVFTSQYKTHKVKVTASKAADQAIIKAVMNYLNANENLQIKKKVYQKSLTTKIHENKLNIIQIDSILQRLGEGNTGMTNSHIFMPQRNFADIHLILREKSRLMDELERLQAKYLKYEKPIVILNKPYWQKDTSFFIKRVYKFPAYLVLLYLLIAFLASGIRKGKRLTAHRK